MVRLPPELDAILRTLPKGELPTSVETIKPRSWRTLVRGGASSSASSSVVDTLGAPKRAPGDARAAREGLPRITSSASSGLPAQLDLKDLLGSGGMGVVRRAIQTALDREVAVKTLHDTSEGNATADELVAEARITGQLEHPNIVPVHLLGEDARGRPVVVMKRIVGTSWAALARAPEHPGWTAFEGGYGDGQTHHLRIFMQVCRAVELAHARGIVHRDIKPHNVMVGSFGEVYLLDWGIALRLDDRDQAAKGAVGTPAYMAPEMLDGARDIDERTDVFLLAATLYGILTGRVRHAGGMPEVFEEVWLCAPPVFEDGELAEELCDILTRATAREKEDRPACVRELREQIAAHLEHRASLALTQRAESAAAELDAALGNLHDDNGRVRVLTTFTRCRHGYALALDAWPQNVVAQRGLARVLRSMFGF